MNTEELIGKYRHQKRAVSTLCCFVMVLEWIDTPHSQNAIELIAGRFETVRGARKVLPIILQSPDLDSYMEQNGVELINHNFMQDGDLLVIDGSHSYIFYCGYLFGVTTTEEVFDFIQYRNVIGSYKTIQAYRKTK